VNCWKVSNLGQNSEFQRFRRDIFAQFLQIKVFFENLIKKGTKSWKVPNLGQNSEFQRFFPVEYSGKRLMVCWKI
jgi:hypothetical protein